VTDAARADKVMCSSPAQDAFGVRVACCCLNQLIKELAASINLIKSYLEQLNKELAASIN
jgi:hypothetical protein